MDNRTDQKSVYRIRAKGLPNYSLTDWLENVQVSSQEHGETLEEQPPRRPEPT
jgi:hypothetical protein